MQSFKENTYKLISASAATIETLGTPAIKHSHKIMLEGSTQIEEGVNKFLDEIEEIWCSPTKVVKYLRKANSLFSEMTKSNISRSYEEKMILMKSVESFLTSEQEDLENYLSKIGSIVHHDWVFSKENRKTMRDLIEVIKVITKNLRSLQYTQIWKYLVLFMAIQKQARKTTCSVQCVPVTESLLEGCRMLKYYSCYSVGIYGKYLVSGIINKNLKDLLSEDNDSIFCKYVRMDKSQLLYSHMNSRKYIPAHAVSIDYNTLSIVLSIRGTHSLFDCMTDLQSNYESFSYTPPFSPSPISGYVHSGIMKSARFLSQEVKSIILSCFYEWPNFSLVLLGHSLGAGVATCLALLWLDDPDFSNTKIQVFAYAPPPVISESLNFGLDDIVTCCVFGNDIVCRLSIGSVQDLSHAVVYLKELEDSNEINSEKSIQNWLNGEEADHEKFAEIYLALKGRMVCDKLVLCGRILQIYNKKRHHDFNLISCGEAENGFSFVSAGFYSELILEKNCFLDHMPDVYEESLLNIVLKVV